MRSTTSASTTSTTTTTATTTATATTRPEFSFDNSVPPPKLINTGKNYEVILRSLVSYGNWLAAHRPDPALVARINARGTKLYDAFTLDLAHLRDNGKRLIETLGGPSSYTIVSKSSDAFSAHLVEDILVHKTVDAAGKVTSQHRYTAKTSYSMVAVLVRGHWLLANVEVQLPAEVHL